MVQDIMRQHNDKVPLIIERYDKERMFFASDESCQISGAESFDNWRLVNGKSVFSMSQTIGQLYDDEKDEDGFLYIVYASQPAFGGENARDGEE
uniref:Autophagy-related protein n=1 Tax=Meloidogyne floridensis TaxID=298350 RepID=A0A915NUL1_9BILA